MNEHILVVLKDRAGERKLYRMEHRRDDGITVVERGKEIFAYDVLLDTRLLDSLAQRAARNRRGFAVDGPLKVKITLCTVASYLCIGDVTPDEDHDGRSE